MTMTQQDFFELFAAVSAPVNYDELVKGWQTTTQPQKC